MSKSKIISLSSGEVEYDIIRSGRRTIALAVKQSGTLIIRAPWYVPAQVLVGFARSKEPWIIRQRKRINEAGSKKKVINYTEGDLIPYLGQNLVLHLREEKRSQVRMNENSIIISCQFPGEVEKVKALVNGWYLREAKKHLISRTMQLSEFYNGAGLKPSSIGVRKMKSRWGTCRTNGRIMLNTELIKKRQELIDAVIIHELCHLKHPNHGKEFYALLENLMPEYKVLRKELRYI
jgi:predicted metal-dependent hydrolase